MLHVCCSASTEAFIQLHMASGLPGNRQLSHHNFEASEAMLQSSKTACSPCHFNFFGLFFPTEWNKITSMYNSIMCYDETE